MSKIVEAMAEGNELENATEWKSRAFALQSVASIIGAVVAIAGAAGYRINLDATQVATIAGGLVAIGYALSALVQVVTTKRIGLPGKSQ